MPALDNIILEFDWGTPILDTAGNNLLDVLGNTLLDTRFDICTDVVDVPIAIHRGTGYDSETERVANTGTMKIVLDNSRWNSGMTQGWYSPDHPAKHTGFGIGTQVRLNLPYTTDYYKFRGRITRIEPETGLLGKKRVEVEISDWMDIAARTLVPRLSVQQSKTDPQILTTVLAAITNPPAETSFDTGDYTYSYALSDLQDEKMTMLSLFQRLALSGLGRIYIVGDAVTGEKLIFESNSTQISSKAIALSLNNDFISLKVYRAAYERVRAVTTTVTPMAVDIAPIVVFSLPSYITLAPGASATFSAYFRDTSAGGRSRLSVINPVTPVSVTDYKFSSVNGSGYDLNGSLIVSVTWGGNSANVTVTNSGGSTGYLYQFNLRAYGLYRNDPISYTATDTTIAEGFGQVLEIRMPYQTNYNVARDIGDSLLTQLSEEVSVLQSVEFVWNENDTIFAAARTLECGDRVGVTDDISGITNVYTVLGYDLHIISEGYIEQTLVLRPYRESIFATLDVTGLSELDGADTLLGY